MFDGLCSYIYIYVFFCFAMFIYVMLLAFSGNFWVVLRQRHCWALAFMAIDSFQGPKELREELLAADSKIHTLPGVNHHTEKTCSDLLVPPHFGCF